MATIDPATCSPLERYLLLIGTVVPRPIAWVSTIDDNGRPNLAPFSFFMGVTASPPTLAISIGHRPTPKDTLTNLRLNGQAVVHLVPPELGDECHASGGEYKAGVDEAEQSDLAWIPADTVKAPRLERAQIALECRLSQEVPVGDPAAALIMLEVLIAHVDDSIADPDTGFPDPERLRAVARLGGRSYLEGPWTVTERGKQTIPDSLRRPR
jgi:flavin reductase (DIM6/NTAB) family NADH-FMN oxidoreductase RutF